MEPKVEDEVQKDKSISENQSDSSKIRGIKHLRIKNPDLLTDKDVESIINKGL